MFGRKPQMPAPCEADSPTQGAVPSAPQEAARAAPARAAAAKSSLISEGFEFNGDMMSDGVLTVDGSIKGNLVVKSLLIGATGLVDGSVKAESISVEGRLLGAAKCGELLIGDRAVVDGKLSYATLAIQRGATVKGELTRD